MPDPALQTPEREYAEVTERSTFPRTKAPIDDTMGYHEFVESEFPEGAGRCDRCGGGPETSIHQKPVDQMERIANALERIANLAEAEFEARLDRSRMSFWEKLRCWWVGL